MKFYYENTKGEIIDFSDFPYLFQEGDLIDSSWKYDEQNGKIINKNRGIGERSFKIAVVPDYTVHLSERHEQLKAAMDCIYEVFDYDAANHLYGKLYSDTGYYLPCQIVASAKDSWNCALPYCFQTFSVISEKNMWIKESSIVYTTGGSSAVNLNGALDYPYDYEYDYGFVLDKLSFENNSFIESDFIMKIQGEVNSPSVYINRHLYCVDVILEAGDILKINSREHKITLTRLNGKVENCFDLRNRDSYVFKKISAGTNTLASAQKLSIMLTYFDERGEPRWS